jgi:CBS-domain-containing membrane protein
MAPVCKALLNLTAGDLMSDSVVMVPEEMSLQGAAHLLTQTRVTGAPVINQEGHCVGVLSATDFVHWVDKNRGGHPHACAGFSSAWQIVDPEALPEDAVHNYMTRDPVEVQAAVPIGELARMMVDAHIHRVIVIDSQRRPIGIVSSTDVLAAVARAAELRHRADVPPGKTNEPVACASSF